MCVIKHGISMLKIESNEALIYTYVTCASIYRYVRSMCIVLGNKKRQIHTTHYKRRLAALDVPCCVGSGSGPLSPCRSVASKTYHAVWTTRLFP